MFNTQHVVEATRQGYALTTRQRKRQPTVPIHAIAIDCDEIHPENSTNLFQNCLQLPNLKSFHQYIAKKSQRVDDGYVYRYLMPGDRRCDKIKAKIKAREVSKAKYATNVAIPPTKPKELHRLENKEPSLILGLSELSEFQ